MPSLSVSEKSGARGRSGFGAGRVVVEAPSDDARVEAVSADAAVVGEDSAGTADVEVVGTEPASLSAPPQADRTTTSRTRSRERTPARYADRLPTDRRVAPISLFVSIVAGTSADHGEMHRVHNESVLLADVVGERDHIVERQVHGAIAHLAHEMMMSVELAEVDHGGTVSEMDVIDRTAFREGLERAVHRRRVDPSTKARLGSLMQDLGSQVLMASIGEHLAHDDPGTSDAHPRRAERTDQVLGGWTRHLSRRTND